MKYKGENSKQILRVIRKPIAGHRNCNLCSDSFIPKTRFDRYCTNCRGHSELLKFGDWLPEAESVLETKLIA